MEHYSSDKKIFISWGNDFAPLIQDGGIPYSHHYVVCRGFTGDGSDATIIGYTYAEAFLDTNVSPARVYYYIVFAATDEEESALKQIAEFSVATKAYPYLDTVPPTTPVGLTATRKFEDIKWSWSGSVKDEQSNMLGYFVDVNGLSPEESARGFIFDLGATQTWIQPVAYRVNYSCRLYAIDKFLNVSEPSNIARGRGAGVSPRLFARYLHPLDEHHPSLEYPAPDSARATLSLLDANYEPVAKCPATFVDIPFTHYWYDVEGNPPSPSPEVMDEYIVVLTHDDWETDALDPLLPYFLLIEWEDVWTHLEDDLFLAVPARTQQLPIYWREDSFGIDYRDWVVEKQGFSGWVKGNYFEQVVTSDAEIWFCGYNKESWWEYLIVGDYVYLARDGPLLSVSFDYDNRCGLEGTPWGYDRTGDAELTYLDSEQYTISSQLMEQGTSGNIAFDASLLVHRPADRRAWGLPPTYNTPVSWPWPNPVDLIIPSGILLSIEFSWDGTLSDFIEWPDGGVHITNFSASQGS